MPKFLFKPLGIAPGLKLKGVISTKLTATLLGATLVGSVAYWSKSASSHESHASEVMGSVSQWLGSAVESVAEATGLASFFQSSSSTQTPLGVAPLSEEEQLRLESDRARTQAILDALFAEEKDLQNSIDARGPVPEVFDRTLSSLKATSADDFLGSRGIQDLQEKRVRTRIRTLMASADYVEDPGLLDTFGSLSQRFSELGSVAGERSSSILREEFGRFFPFTVGAGVGAARNPASSDPTSGGGPALESKIARHPIPLHRDAYQNSLGQSGSSQSSQFGNDFSPVVEETASIITKFEVLVGIETGLGGTSEGVFSSGASLKYQNMVEANHQFCLRGADPEQCQVEKQVALSGAPEAVQFELGR